MRTLGIRVKARNGSESMELEISIQGKKKGRCEPQASN